MQLLMALKLYTLLNEELIPFEEMDAPDMFYQYYPTLYPEGAKGTYSDIENVSYFCKCHILKI